MLGLVLLGGLTGVLFARSYQDMVAHMQELYTLRQVVSVQHDQIDALVRHTENLADDVRLLEQLDRQVQDLIAEVPLESDGLRPAVATGVSTGVGGPEAGLGGRPVTGGVAEIRGLASSRSTAQVVNDNQADFFAAVPSYGVDRAALALERITTLRRDVSAGLPQVDAAKARISQHADYLARRPSEMPAVGDITSDYGWRISPFGWGRTFHKGIDIGGAYGDEIYATGEGEVIFSGWMAEYGYTVMIDHGYGFITLYSHNQKNLVAEGDLVQRGDVVALMGSSGKSTGPHVHYEVWIGGVPVDPVVYLKAPGPS